jgi:tetratricopeptide (TPR) repeat protein
MVLRKLAVAWISGDGGSLTRGTALLEEYVAREPGDEEARRYLVSNLLRLAESDRARTWAEDLDQDPESLTLRALAIADQDPITSMEVAARALDGDVEQPDAHRLLARLTEAIGDFDAAYLHAWRVIRLDPFDPKAYSVVIRLARYRCDEETAAKMVEGLEIAGRLVQSREAGQLPLLEELRLVDRLGELVGADSVPYRKRQAKLLIAAGRIDRGMELVHQLEDDDRLSGGRLLPFARQLADLKRFNDARKLYRSVLEEAPDNATARSSAALCDLALGETESARVAMESALAERPEWAGFHAVMGRIELQIDRPQEAILSLERALELAPWEMEWRLLLADILRAEGHARRADRVLESAPQIPVVENAPMNDADRASRGPDRSETAEGPPWFVDVAADVGVDFVQYDGRSGERFYIETTGSGCGFLDYDDDGDLDMYLLTGAPTPGAPIPIATPRNRLYENREGRFVDITDSAGVGDDGFGMGMCVADIDRDGLLDFMVANYGPDRLYRNLGDGRFEEVAERAGVDDSRWGSNCAFGDIDADGDLDLYVSHYLHFDFNDNPKCGDSARKIYGYCRPSSFRGVTDSLFINDGTGVFAEEIRSRGIKEGVLEKGFGVVMTDIDSDRDLDIFVANDSTPNRLYINNGTGVFEDGGLSCGVAVNAEGMTTSGMGVDIADIDGDGLMDIALTNYSMEPNGLYHNLGRTRFADVAAERGVAGLSLVEVGWGVVLADFDNDGDRDMVVANGHVVDNIREFEPGHSYEQTNVLLLNDGHGRFTDATLESGMSEMPTRVSRSLAVGDWNNDGRLDLLVSNCNDRFELLENRISNDNHWLGIRLEGRRENRFAIGARVEAVVGESNQVDEVRSGSSFQAQRDLRLHFGLGGQPGPVEVRVYWPDGSEQTEVVDEVDRYVTITQE